MTSASTTVRSSSAGRVASRAGGATSGVRASRRAPSRTRVPTTGLAQSSIGITSVPAVAPAVTTAPVRSHALAGSAPHARASGT